MRTKYRQRCRTVAAILGVGAFVVLLVCAGAYAAEPTPAKDKAEQVEQRFNKFKKELEDRIDARIDTIAGWMPAEQGDPFKAVIVGVREPMIERLVKTKKEFITGLDKKKSEIQNALTDEESVKAQLNGYFETTNAKLMKNFFYSRFELSALLTAKPLTGRQMLITGGVFIVALIPLIWGIVKIIANARQDERDSPQQPARLVKGTVRSVIALAITYLILLLALTDFVLNRRIGGYLSASFTAVIVFYFGSRAMEAFYARKAGFSYIKTSPDGSKEKIEGYETPEAVKRIATLSNQIEEMANAVDNLRLGSIGGKVTFDPDVDDKARVKVNLVHEKKVFATTETDEQGYYYFQDVPRGIYEVKAEKEGHTPVPETQQLDLPVKMDKIATDIAMKKVPEEDQGKA